MNRTNIKFINLFRLSLKKYIKSIIFKKGCYIVFIKSVKDLTIFIKIVKSLTLFNYKMLIEIFAVDYPSKLLRFELSYILRSLNCKGLLILKIPVTNKILVPSLSKIYDSAN
jgi:NADH-quinone oxidoreductase subunit C